MRRGVPTRPRLRERFANGGKPFPAKYPPSPTGVLSLGVVRPETDAQHGVKMAGFIFTFGVSAQQVLLHGRVLCEVEKSTSKESGFPNAVPFIAVEVTHALPEAFVLRRDPGKDEPFQPSHPVPRRNRISRQRQMARRVTAITKRGAARTVALAP